MASEKQTRKPAYEKKDMSANAEWRRRKAERNKAQGKQTAIFNAAGFAGWAR